MKIVFQLCLIFLFSSCSMTTIKPLKVNGVSFVAARDSITDIHIKPVVNINANYAAIMPYGFFRDIDNPKIIYNTDRQWFGESKPGAKQYIKALRNQGIKVMMKPHIWIGRGTFYWPC